MNIPLKIVFMGTPEFAVPTLKALIEGEDWVVLVVTQPDRPRGRGREPMPPPVKILAEENNIEVMQPESVSDTVFLDRMEGLSPDIVVVAAFGQFLPKRLLDIPRLGCINAHSSILPKYRGAAPAIWAILKGEKITGITTFIIDEGMDTGDVLLIKKISIGEDETAGELTERLSVIGAMVIMETIDGLKDGKITPVPQNHEKKTLAPLLKKEDGRIDWNKTPDEIKNHVRGMNPWPGALTLLGREKIKIFRIDVADGGGAGSVGKVIEVGEGGIVVAVKGGCVVIRELQAPGKKRMEAVDFLRGKGVEVGTALG
jgi:methionyl-tRNA formyltransferase